VTNSFPAGVTQGRQQGAVVVQVVAWPGGRMEAKVNPNLQPEERVQVCLGAIKALANIAAQNVAEADPRSQIVVPKVGLRL
jgi:hypothetical protein